MLPERYIPMGIQYMRALEAMGVLKLGVKIVEWREQSLSPSHNQDYAQERGEGKSAHGKLRSKRSSGLRPAFLKMCAALPATKDSLLKEGPLIFTFKNFFPLFRKATSAFLIGKLCIRLWQEVVKRKPNLGQFQS